ncbi:MAG: hypothetical protein ACR2OM_02375 [Aestuariivirgaceae bacterium]
MDMTHTATRMASALAGAALIASLGSTAVQAAEMSSKADIQAAVSGKTYQGSMLKDAFAEYYDADGTIRAKGYGGKWRVADGSMCFQYGDKPERCWDVRVEGTSMTMYRDGKVHGNGMLVEGNPHNF